MKCKVMQFMMMMMEVEEDRRKRYDGHYEKEEDEERKWKRRKKGSGEREEEKDIADFFSDYGTGFDFQQRDKNSPLCATFRTCLGLNTASYKIGYLLRGSKEAGTCS